MSTPEDSTVVASVPSGVDDAVGVEKSGWFVAIVNNRAEKAAKQRLDKMGYDSYVATQTVMRLWNNGRRAKVERVVIPSTVFIRCTEKERRHIVTLPFINRFMTNKAGGDSDASRKPLAIIPDSQIALLRFMLGNSDTPVTISQAYRKGDRVRVIRGSLCGLEGEVIRLGEGRSELIVCIDMLGCACLEVDPVNLERI